MCVCVCVCVQMTSEKSSHSVFPKTHGNFLETSGRQTNSPERKKEGGRERELSFLGKF